MQKSEIAVGEEYGVREIPKTGASLQHVRIIQHVRGTKWKAEWIDPNPGLVDYLESKTLVVRWKERRAFLKDEESDTQFWRAIERQGYQRDSPIDNALTEVFESAGERSLSYYRGALTGMPDELERLRSRAKSEHLKQSPYTYIDRYGTIHVPFDEAVELAKAFCAAEPSTVLPRVETTEREWSIKASQPGNEYVVGLLSEYRAAWALVRQWAGLDAAIAEREKHVQHLERLVWDAIYALQKAGLESEAHRLRRVVSRE